VFLASAGLGWQAQGNFLLHLGARRRMVGQCCQ